MRPLDRCDHLRGDALHLAVEVSKGGSWAPNTVVDTAQAFLTFLLGAPASSTKEDIEAMERIIREDEERPGPVEYVGVDPEVRG